MNTRRTSARILEENDVNEEIPPQVEQVIQGDQAAQVYQGDQVPIVGGGNDVLVVPPKMTNGDIREALLTLVRSLTTNMNRGIEPRVNVVESTMTSRLRDIVNMNPPTFLVSKVVEGPQEFLDGVYKVLSSMGVTSRGRRS
ncbi:hypothetical protein EJD97_016460 [Solanum chilense]|uniref:Gag-pol polyprotein n=1 Tax=Solanum chilense TaxID=4083 RepID=A0A6N2B9S3_SOLCI|nr:hypothetical protein EJD97_016460 [Solanum chilense]